MASYFHIPGFSAFSAGTEVTAFHSNTLIPLKAVGICIAALSDGANPQYEVEYELEAGNGRKMICFSKLISDEANPKTEFCAVMTCR